jgi:hypothetical protein
MVNNTFKDSVSVFHFTSRISSAKIKKYKIATERGMGPDGQRASSNQPHNGPVITPAPQVAPVGTLHPPPASASPPATGSEPPPKKPKLRLNVRPPGPDESPASGSMPTPGSGSMPIGDNIEVARPRRDSSLRIKYSNDMKLEDESLRRASLDSSDLSSVGATPPPPQPTRQLKERSRSPADPDYGDLMNYYILDGGEEEKPKAPPPVKSPKPRAPRQSAQQKQQHSQHHQPHQPHQQHAPQQQQQMPMPMQPPRDHNIRHPAQHGPPSSQYLPPPRPQQPPLILPQVQLIDFDTISRPAETRKPETVQDMIRKLEALSTALSGFSGVPDIPRSPGSMSHLSTSFRTTSANHSAEPALPKQPEPQPQKPAKPQKLKKSAGKKGDAIDGLLGMFDADDEESDEEEEGQGDSVQQPAAPNLPDLSYILQNPGEPDSPLTYGIRFIQNALRSWAQQRITHQMAPQIHQQAQQWAHQQAQRHKRGPGRPRKFTDTEESERVDQPTAPPPIQIRAEQTPEGQAVKAFQQVIDSGCLQMNAVLPVELTRALRHLYMQIDQLINQGSKSEPQWQCMSYGAQIAANQVRVEKWKEAQAKAQEEMARQQQLAQQQVMQQMGLPVHPTGHPTQEQMVRQHEIDLERRRSQHHAQQQPYLSKHLLNPLLLGSQPPGTPAGFAINPSNGNTNGQRNGSQAPTPTSAGPTPQGAPNPQSPVNSNSQQHMEKVKMYMPGYMPRSGAQMKFSFTPTNENAVRVFGSDAFPNGNQPGPPVSAKGAMAAIPGQASTPIDVDAPAGTPVVRSIEVSGQTNGSKDKRKRGASEGGKNGAQGGDNDVEMIDVMPVKKEAQSTPTIGFTAVNAPQRPISVSASSPVVNGPAGSPNGNVKAERKGSHSDIASRFPHPGAIIVDQ